MTRIIHQTLRGHNGELAPGDIYITRDGYQLIITQAPNSGLLACEGCYYRKPTQLVCHTQPPCKWHTRKDHQNIIYSLSPKHTQPCKTKIPTD